MKLSWLLSLCLLVPLSTADPAAIKKAKLDLAKPRGKQGPTKNVMKTPNTSHDIKEKGTKEEAKEESTQEDIPMPDTLNLENFDQTTSERLTFVEFFSPYCSHCMALKPTWEKTYRNFLGEMQDLNIDMRQVNCVESGDLCEREQVNSYPNLRLYAPDRDPKSGEFNAGKSKFVDSFPVSLTRTEENFKKFLKNAVAEFMAGSIDLPLSSIPVTVDQVLALVGGEYEEEEPFFVTFFPAKDEQWEETDKTGTSKFYPSCRNCIEYKQTWDKLSNHVLSIVKTGHFNCLSNPTVCRKLGFDVLSSTERSSTPKAIMFLPKLAGIIKFDYEGEYNLKKMKVWASKLFENFKYQKVSAADLMDNMEYKKSLPFEPLDAFYPLSNKVLVIFFFDPKTVTDEDRAILPYLLEEVTRSPFNINLYTAKHAKIEANIKTQAENLIQFINYDEKAVPKKFNNEMFLSTSLTTKPTIFIVKDNTLFTTVFQSFAPEDIRNAEKVTKFVKQNQFPLFQELTPELLPHYFDDKLDATTKDNKVVVFFINSEDAMRTNKELFNVSLAAHEYHNIRQEYYFQDILNKREAKQATVEKLKQQNAESMEIIQEMRKEVPHLYDSNQVLFTFIDLANNAELAYGLGWNDEESYVPGDAIIVSKDDKYFWNTNLKGEKLTNDPYHLKPVLQYLLDPTLVSEKFPKVSFKRHTVGSPYGGVFSFMDYFHAQGILGYVQVIALLYAIIFMARKLINKRTRLVGRSRGTTGLGIIGNLSKKD